MRAFVAACLLATLGSGVAAEEYCIPEEPDVPQAMLDQCATMMTTLAAIAIDKPVVDQVRPLRAYVGAKQTQVSIEAPGYRQDYSMFDGLVQTLDTLCERGKWQGWVYLETDHVRPDVLVSAGKVCE